MTSDARKFRGLSLDGVEVVKRGTGSRMSALCRCVRLQPEKLDWRFKTGLLLTGHPLTRKDRALIRRGILFLRIDANYHLVERSRRS